MRTHLEAIFTADRLGRTCAALFVTSTMFPVAAGVYPQAAPRSLGLADVGVAALLVTAAIGVALQNQAQVTDNDRLAAFRVSQVVMSIIPALLVLFLIATPRFHWDVLVVGLAWRGWLLMYTLPFLVAAQRQGAT